MSDGYIKRRYNDTFFISFKIKQLKQQTGKQAADNNHKNSNANIFHFKDLQI